MCAVLMFSFFDTANSLLPLENQRRFCYHELGLVRKLSTRLIGTLLEELKRRYPEWNDFAFLLKHQILSLVETQKALLRRYLGVTEDSGSG